MSDIFLGRQVILDKNLETYAYELLFRRDDKQSTSEVASGIDEGDIATSRVMLNSVVEIGLNELVGQHRAFINLTRNFIENPNMIVAPPQQVVLEILEDVEPDQACIKAVKALKKQGHTIALDDFCFSEKFRPLLELADIIKIDVLALSEEELHEHLAHLKQYPLKLLAEKVETAEQFERLKALGFDYFQGYFFSKPTIIRGKGLPSNLQSVLRLLTKLYKPDIEIAEVSELISHDVSLSHKVLKFINSPLSGLRTEVESIQQAVTLMGLATIRNWVTVLALAARTDKPHVLTSVSMTRARFCELLARQCKIPKPEGFFTVGLFSTLDAMMDQPLVELVKDLPLHEEAKSALLEHQGKLGEALNCAIALEQSDFSLLGFQELSLIDLSEIHLKALHWSDEMSLHCR